MRTRIATLAAILMICGAGFALARDAYQPPTSGYLTLATTPDVARILPPAPTPGTDRYNTDRAVFKATRALQGTPRWTLAQNDVSSAVGDTLADFNCALGVTLTAANAPQLSGLLTRVGKDAGRQVTAAKNVFKRQRPFVIDEGAICEPRTDDLAASPDYPSGHTTWGWSAGLILAELAPDRATEILVRARAFGESRVVCGVHNASAIEAGRTTGATLVAALHADRAFRADLEAARAEVARAREFAGPLAPACSAQAALIAATPY
jgi:acid phosphatase (class A)